MTRLTTKRIVVLMGGPSAEHAVSVRSGLAVWTSLMQKGYDAIPLDVESSVAARLREMQGRIAFIALHGPGGEDGTIQGMLETIRLPYTGSGVQACALAMDKALTKMLLEQSGLPVPRGMVVALSDRRKSLPKGLAPPLVVKPLSQGSTFGITIVRQARQLQKALDAAFVYGPTALVEEYIDGRELTVGILNDQPLPVVEIIPKGGFYDFAAKYTSGDTVYKAPAHLPERTATQLQSLALQAHRRLGCRGATRVDFRLDRQGHPFILELNTVPGMTETSLLPMAAKAAGFSYETMVEAILESALAREAEWASARLS